MDIKELQKAWKKMSDESSAGKMLDEEQIRMMLGKHTKNLLERIDLNIRIGFAVLLIIIVSVIAIDFISAGGIPGENNPAVIIPGWLVRLDMGVNLLIIVLFVTFFIRYWTIRRRCRNVCDLRHNLLKTIRMLTQYQRLFTVALVIILLVSATGFTAGYYTSVNLNNTMEGFLLPVLTIGLILLVMITGMIFLLLRWMFRRIYGNYLRGLRQTLAELEELK